jgi:hypothetical protein
MTFTLDAGNFTTYTLSKHETVSGTKYSLDT